MLKTNILTKITLFLLLINISAYSCNTAAVIIPIADAYVNIEAKESKTSFNITWKFKKDFVASLSKYDKNKNGKFDKDEKEEIKKIFIGYVEENNYITDIVYVKKEQKIRKSLINKINAIDSGLIFSNNDIKYYYNFDTDFVLKDNHRLYMRFLDPKQNVNLELKDVVVNNYSGKKVINPQHIRANIYFYDYVAENRVSKDTCSVETHKHDEYHDDNVKL
jgi:hypothetical protein